jgi:hypothetical protein
MNQAETNSVNRGPLHISGLGESEPGGRQLEIAIWAVVGLGIGLRLLRYLLQFPLWVDEAKLAASLLDRGYLELLEPLNYGQTSPVGFLWLSLTAVKIFGFNELALRLVSCTAAIGSVLVMRRLSSRLLDGLPLLIAVTLFSVSYYPIRFTGEVKPYATDLFVAVVLLAIAVEWWAEPRRSRWLWILTVLAPIAILVSNPAIFVAGGIGIALMGAVWRSGSWKNRVALALFGLFSIGAFWITYDGVTRAQYESSVALAHTTDFWTHAFPPLTDPIGLARWLVLAHSGRMFGYPVGFDAGGGAITFVLFVIGSVVFFRRRCRTALALLLLPFGLALVAAALRMYPYGLSGRISQWAAPAICILAATGVAGVITRFSSARVRTAAARATLGFLVFFGVAQGVADVIHPYKAQRDRSARDFARWFWVEEARDAELLCAWNDLELPFARPHGSHVLGNGQYWCNQRIYSPRHRSGEVADLGRVADDHPIRVVFLRSMINTPGNGFAEWLDEMRLQYQQVGMEQHKPAHYTDSPDFEQEEVVVFEFKPRTNPEVKRFERKQKRRGKRQSKKPPDENNAG